MGYVPPQLRDKINYKSKNLSRKQNLVIDYTKLKTIEDLLKEYHKENYGKADQGWEENILSQDNKK